MEIIVCQFRCVVSPEEHGGGPGLAVLESLVEALTLRGLPLKLGTRAPPPGVARELELADVGAPAIWPHCEFGKQFKHRNLDSHSKVRAADL